MELDAVRAFAASLPGTTEEPHFDRWSFRVGGKIYATYGADPSVNVFVDKARVPEVLVPGVVEELYWGKQLAGVRVLLAGAPEETVHSLLTEAWRRKAPKRLGNPRPP